MDERTSKKTLKVLVIDEEVPYPPDAGKRIRTWNLLKSLAQKHCVHLLCYGRNEDSNSTAMRSAGIELHLVEPLQESAGLFLYLRLLANLLSPYPFSVTKHYSRRFRRTCKNLLGSGVWGLTHCESPPSSVYTSSIRTTQTLIATTNRVYQTGKGRVEL